MAEKKINDPGVRVDASGGHTVQWAKRSAQLDSIAEGVNGLLNRADAGRGVILPPAEVFRIRGWMEQVGIIADELKAAGK